LSIKIKDLLQSAIKSKCTNVILNIHENQTYGKSEGVLPKLNIVNILKIISYKICGFLNLLHLCGEYKKIMPLFRPQIVFLKVPPCGFQQLDRVSGCGT
jgi:hypothetical protein